MTNPATDTKTPLVGRIDELPSSTAMTHSADSRRPLAAAADLAAPSMQQLLHFAIEKGTPVEQLERLVDLAERMEAKEARRAYHAALARFQAKVRPIFRAKTAEITTKSGGKFAYKYAELDDIVREIAGPLAEEDLSYGWNTRIEKNMLTVETIVRHVAGHSEPTSFTLPIDSSAAMSEQQKYGAALTFGQRRGLSAALGLVTSGEDPDSPKLDPTPIGDDQITVIEDLLAESGASRARFLKYMDADKVESIRQADYGRAVASLEEVKAKKEQRART